MTRGECVQQAAAIVCGERYGAPEDNFGVIAEFWTTYIKAKCVSKEADVNILPEDVAVLMVLLKIGRVASSLTASADCFVDLAGYAACACQMATEE